jgi:hypothetical protein
VIDLNDANKNELDSMFKHREVSFMFCRNSPKFLLDRRLGGSQGLSAHRSKGKVPAPASDKTPDIQTVSFQ